MRYTIYNYRHAEEIINSPHFASAFQEVEDAILRAPLFTFPYRAAGGAGNAFDVIQQVLNTYFDRRLAVDYGWTYHPPATLIPGSQLAADFRKSFPSPRGTLAIQVEVQFGNAARWYTDIFKFQAAYSADMIHMGISIVPVLSLANRMDSNIINYERAERELPAAKLSITHPVLLIGIEPDATTPVYDLTATGFSLNQIKARGARENRYRIVNAYLAGLPEASVNAASPTGPMP